MLAQLASRTACGAHVYEAKQRAAQLLITRRGSHERIIQARGRRPCVRQLLLDAPAQGEHLLLRGALGGARCLSERRARVRHSSKLAAARLPRGDCRDATCPALCAGRNARRWLGEGACRVLLAGATSGLLAYRPNHARPRRRDERDRTPAVPLAAPPPARAGPARMQL